MAGMMSKEGMNEVVDNATETMSRAARGFVKPSKHNVGDMERWASLAGGALLAAMGIRRGGMTGMAMGLIGTSLLHRGATGYCALYDSMGVNTSDDPTTAGASLNHGIKVEKSITINRSASDLYKFWRQFDNLSQIMEHLESVTVTDEKRSHWVAKGPAGISVEWDAEIVNERENELIAWRSIGDSEVDNAGSVRFETAPGGRGTVVRVSLLYNPPAGRLGAAVAKLFGEEPSLQIHGDLMRFKQLMETGEIATTKGQPSCRD